ncbi:MAG: 4Fe-4S binding protein [Deltaproteobacteria bacterium]|nr:4Fe-4S binding protein [Deltaproteobacteria bacterium]
MPIPTPLLGRVFCNWMCPYDPLHQFVGFFSTSARTATRSTPTATVRCVPGQVRHPRRDAGDGGFQSLQIGLLDPIHPGAQLRGRIRARLRSGRPGALVRRSRAVVSMRDLSAALFAPGASHHWIFAGAWFVGAMIVGLLGMNLVILRFFCCVPCPLGAFLGVR